MGETSAEIAVVIPTRGRETRLAFALDALAAQTLDRRRFEVIVVRDEDAPRPLATAPAGLRARFLFRPGTAGPTAKRNLGWRSAAAPLVAFTDDDCRPDPAWLEELISAGAGEDVFLQGRTEPDPDERQLLHGFARTQRISSPTRWYETCNMAYPRALLERLGGFDERFPFGGEDTDLAYRALELGARPRFVDGARVFHAVVSRSLPSAFREAVRWNAMPAVVARHPQLHEVLYRRYFWDRAHFALPLSALGLLLARGHPVRTMLALLPYAEVRVNWREPTPRRVVRAIAALPVWATLDATEIVARLPNAVRHRVAVL